jgi:carbamoyl-phosphate synthase large subunit
MAANTFRVLITGAGTTTAVTVLKGLRAAHDASLRVFMGDVNPDCAGARLGDRFLRMPPAAAEDFGPRVIQLCREHRIDLVFPILDYEFLGWCSVAGWLGELGTRVILSPKAALLRCIEKDRTYDYFRSLDIPTIPTWRAGEIVDANELPYPVYLKPRCGRASLDNYRADDPDEYRAAVRKVPDAIVQPFTGGDEVTIDTVSDLQGRFLAACPRLRLEVKSGQAYRSRTFTDPELVALARRIVEGLPIVGAANVQCFLTADGPRFFEINARFGAGTILSIEAGLNGPRALVDLARGRSVGDLTPRPGVLMLRYWQEVFTEQRPVPPTVAVRRVAPCQPTPS